MFILIVIFTTPINAQLLTYPNAPNALPSSIFSLNCDGTNISVFKYMDYHYASFSLAGTAEFTIITSEKINTFKISPTSLGIQGTKLANTLKFTLSQVTSTDETPKYLVIQINSLQKLVILADKPEENVPASSGSGIYNITSSPYNADPTGKTNTQPAIQKAIDDASVAGGGVVFVPIGLYQIREMLTVKSNVILYLAPGSVIKAVDDRSQYPQTATINPALVIENSNNVKIIGRGEIDASGLKIMNPPSSSNTISGSVDNPRRRILRTDGSSNITFEGVIFKDATGWSLDLMNSTNILCQNIKILNHKDISKKIENDGIDLVSSSNSVVNQCFVMTIDDAMCAKARYSDMDNLVFSNNVTYTSSCGLKVGMQCVGSYSNILFSNCDVIHCRRGIGIDTRSEGNENHPITGIVFKDIKIEETESTNAGGNYCVEMSASLANITDVRIVNCNCNYNNKIHFAGRYSIKNITFEGLIMKGKFIKYGSQVDINNDNHATYSFKASLGLRKNKQ